MHVTKRTAKLTLPAGHVVNVNILIETHKKIMSIDTEHLAAKTVMETPNTELLTPATVTLTDTAHDRSFVTEVVASNAGPRDYYGAAVAVDGNRLIVGAHLEDTMAYNAGKVYVYDWNGGAYVEVSQLTASDAQGGDQFGTSVAVSGNRLIVGAVGKSTTTYHAGKVYVYEWNSGTSTYDEVTTVLASTAATNTWFGTSVALSSDSSRLVVGAYGDGTGGLEAGKVYVYNWNSITSTYDEVTTVLASTAAAKDWFGGSVALSGDGIRLVVGAPLEDSVGLDAGKVYVYNWNSTTSTYDEVAQLTASDTQVNDQFGSSLAISSDKLVVGAQYEDTPVVNAGKVYVYTWNAATSVYDEVTTITASNAVANDYFGSAVAISGNRLVVGASGEDTGGLQAGKVYSLDLYAEITNGGRFTLLSSNVAPHSELGYMVYYDKKYNDIIVIPSLELYKSMSYLNNQILTILGYGVNFSGVAGDKLPALNPLYDVKSTLAGLTNYVKNQARGVYYERMVTPTLNYSSASISPVLLINFGTPLTMFPVLNFVTDINVFGYDSLFTNNPQHLGNQKLQDIGTLVVGIPL